MNPLPLTKPELTCLRCGYDLRGGAPAGKCPECGTSIGASYFHKALRRKLVRASLADANPTWRKSILLGMQCLTAMVLIDFITPMIAHSGVPSSAWPYVDASLAACCWVLLIVATFKLTQPQ